jgi:hypothetical protein
VRVNSISVACCLFVYGFLGACGDGKSPVAPEIVIVSPAEGKTVSGMTKVTGTVSGDVNLVLVDCGDSRFVQATGAPSWSADCDTKILPDGTTTLTARAIGFDRKEVSTSLGVTVSNVDPLVGIWDSRTGGTDGYPGQYIVFYKTGVFDEASGNIFYSFASSWQRQGPEIITVHRMTAAPVTVSATLSADGKDLILRWSSLGTGNHSANYGRRGS